MHIGIPTHLHKVNRIMRIKVEELEKFKETSEKDKILLIDYK